MILAPSEVRRRAAMYVGDTGPKGLLHLVYEVLDNAVDLHLLGACGNIDVHVLHDGAVRIRDDGPGFPVGDDGAMLLRALTELHSGPTKDGHPVHVHLAAHGLGLPVVHALSDRIEVTTSSEGRCWVIAGGAGQLTDPPRDVGPSSEPGTTVLFRPDPTLFPGAALDAAALLVRLREVVALCPGLTIRYSDERVLELRAEDGLDRLLGVPSLSAGPCYPAPWRPAAPLAARSVRDGMSAELRLQWGLDGEPHVRSFVNLRETAGGGSHVDGLRLGLATLAQVLQLDDPDEVTRALGQYIVAVVSVSHPEPMLQGISRYRLVNPEIGPLVAGAVASCLSEFAVERPDEARALVEWVLERDQRVG